MAQKRISHTCFLLSILISSLFYYNFSTNNYAFFADSLGYYSYLPSTFIYHNFHKFDSLPSNKGIPQHIVNYMEDYNKNCIKSPKGYFVNQYTYGVAWMELPFFLIAHTYEKANGLQANGYSDSYNWAIKIGNFIYALLGLWFIFLIIQKISTTDIAIITASLLLVGTNLFWFTFEQPGMAHVPIFFLYALFIWCSLKLFENAKLKYFVLAAFCGGIIVVSRPTDAVLLIFPLVYKIYDWESLKEKIIFLKNNYLKIVLAFLVFCIPIVPQLLFWKKYAGSFLYYSYTTQTFAWNFDHILGGLFGVKNGLLAYSPIMFFALLGLLFFKKSKVYLLSISSVFILYVLIIYSWWCYTYINGFGSRPMIHIYPLLAIPFSFLITYIFQQKKWIQMLAFSIFAFCVYYNVSLSIHQSKRNLSSESSTWHYNLSLLFKQNIDYYDLLKLDLDCSQPDTKEVGNKKIVGKMNFEDSTGSKYLKDTLTNLTQVMKIKSDEEYSPNLKVTYQNTVNKKIKWIQCSGDFYVDSKSPSDYSNSLMVFDVQRDNKSMLWTGVNINNKIGYLDSLGKSAYQAAPFKGINRKWGKIQYYLKLPKDIQNGDVLTLGIWNMGYMNLLVDNLELNYCYENDSEN